MAKTSVNNIVVRAKRNTDYNITDTDLDAMIIDMISDALKLVYQWLYDAGRFVDIGTSATLATIANQAYIDISTSLATADAIYRLSERTNDTVIELIPYSDFVAYYPDPTAESSNTPDHAAVWANRLYLGPTPSAVISIYAEYVAIPADVSTGGTMPYKTKYDPLILALVRRSLQYYFDANNVNSLTGIDNEIERLRVHLITMATRDTGTRREAMSRRPEMPYIAPRKNVD